MNLFSKISNQERVEFAKNLAVMLKSGVAIDESLGSLAKQARRGQFRNILLRVKKTVETGTSLSEAFSKEGRSFGQVFLNMIKAGEASGTLEENLTFLADWLERNNDLRKEMKAATLYPKIVLAATFLLGGALTTFILPKLIPIFRQLRVALPPTTRLLLSFSNFVNEYWLLVFLGVIGLVVLYYLLIRLRPFRKVFHAISLRMPFTGRLVSDYQLALVSQLLSTLFRSGLPIGEVLSITSEAATNIHYQESIEKIRKRILKGTTLSNAMADEKRLYSGNFVSIVAVGEKSGTLENSFEHLANFYAKEVNNKIKKLPTTIEPVLLIIIGLTIGFVALSIIMPIYQLTEGIQR